MVTAVSTAHKDLDRWFPVFLQHTQGEEEEPEKVSDAITRLKEASPLMADMQDNDDSKSKGSKRSSKQSGSKASSKIKSSKGGSKGRLSSYAHSHPQVVAGGRHSR